ncbi:MAG: PD40 domain-containing protein [Deltaproteobacteria bacterium]|nr:PD40 domain-containing protein [Deltaproteobacteria bacterium]
MRRLALLVPILLASCDKADLGPADTGTGDGGDVDAGSRRCDPQSELGPPLGVPGLSAASGATFTSDEREVFFSSPVAGSGQKLFRAVRDDPRAAFGPANPLGLVGTDEGTNEYGPHVVDGGLTLVFHSDLDGADFDLYLASRTNTAVPFGDTSPIGDANTDAEEFDPWMAPDGLYFSSNREGSEDFALYRAPVVPGGGLGTPRRIAELDSPGAEWAPVLSHDGRTIWFASNRSDGPVAGDMDVWTAERPDVDTPFSNARPVVAVSSSGLEFPSWVSENGCRLYLDRGAGGPTLIATREP